MNFKFIQDYDNKIEEIKGKVAVLETDLLAKETELKTLNHQYKLHINHLELEEAAKLKHEIKLAEAEFETQKDILKVMENRIKFGDQEAALVAVEGYKEFLLKQEKAKEKIIARADKKKREYLEAVKEIAAHNAEIRVAHARMVRIKDVSKSNECISTANAEIDSREYYVHQSDF